MSYFSNSESDRKYIMEFLGIKNLDELIENIPPEIRLKGQL
ncbi:hypothetical protein DRQ09_08420, partial [candidate division KSB1 bacterium]